MQKFNTKKLLTKEDYIAPDGSEIRLLLELRGGNMAHFTLPSNQTSRAVYHKTVEEIWFFLSGQGEMWRKTDELEEVVKIEPNVCITIPVGTHFQFRSLNMNSLTAICVTMPPWPGKNEATLVKGKWKPTLP